MLKSFYKNMNEENIKYLSHEEFVNEYKNGNLRLLINKRLEHALYSPFLDRFEVLAYIFWDYISIALVFIVPIILLFLKKSWIYILGSFFMGIIIYKSNRKSLEDCVLENMLRNEKFWGEMLLAGIVLAKDKTNNKILPLQELSEKILNEILSKNKNK